MIKINLIEDCDQNTIKDLEDLITSKVPEIACKNGNITLLNKLIVQGYTITKNCWIQAALHRQVFVIQYAIQNGFYKMIDEYVFKAAIEGGSKDVIIVLSEAFPDFKRKDRGDFVDIALEKGNLYLVEWLLSQGFNLGRYSFHAAKKSKYNLHCIDFILEQYYKTNNLERINQSKGGLFFYIINPNKEDPGSSLNINFNKYMYIKKLFLEDKELNEHYNSSSYVLNSLTWDPDYIIKNLSSSLKD